MDPVSGRPGRSVNIGYWGSRRDVGWRPSADLTRVLSAGHKLGQKRTWEGVRVLGMIHKCPTLLTWFLLLLMDKCSVVSWFPSATLGPSSRA